MAVLSKHLWKVSPRQQCQQTKTTVIKNILDRCSIISTSSDPLDIQCFPPFECRVYSIVEEVGLRQNLKPEVGERPFENIRVCNGSSQMKHIQNKHNIYDMRSENIEQAKKQL